MHESFNQLTLASCQIMLACLIFILYPAVAYYNVRKLIKLYIVQ